MWTKEFPTEQGWYFWRKREKQTDPFVWYVYFIDKDGTVWSDGTAVFAPHSGWYKRINVGDNNG